MRSTHNGYKPKSERYRKGVAIVTGIGMVAAAAGCGATASPNRAGSQSGKSKGTPVAETMACTPVLENGAQPHKLSPPSSQHNQWASKQQEIDVETSVEAYSNATEVANVVVNLPLTKNALSHFQFAPLDNAEYADFNISDFMWSAGQPNAPVDQYDLQMPYPFCVNVNGEVWLTFNQERVSPQYDHGATSPKYEAGYASGQLWIKPSTLSQIPGVKMFAYKGMADSSVIAGHYDKWQGTPSQGFGPDIHFKNVNDDYYGSINAAPKASVEAIMQLKNVTVIDDLEQYLASH